MQLEQMTAVALRKFAKDEGIRITYLSERKKEDLVEKIREALKLRERAASE